MKYLYRGHLGERFPRNILLRLIGSLKGYFQLDANARKAVIAQALVAMSISVQNVDLGIYLRGMGYSPGEVGLLFSTTSIVAIALLLPGGILADTYGRRRIASLGLLIGGLVMLGYLYPINLFYLLSLAVLGGIGSALYGGSIAAILADIAPTPERRNLLFSVSASTYSLAGVLGSLAGGIPSYLASLGLSAWYQYLPVIAIMGGSLLQSSLLILSIGIGSTGNPGSGRPSLVLPIKSRSVIIRGMAYGVLFSLSTGLIGSSIFSLWLNARYGASVGVISYIYAAAQFILMFAFLASPAIARNLGSVASIVTLQAIGFSLLLPIILVDSLIAAGLLYASIIILLSMPNPILRSFIIGLVDPSERASASTVIALSMNLSSSFAPAVTGYYISAGLLKVPLYLSMLIGISSVALFYSLFSGYEKRAN
ncbi:MAG: MFS transporter [Desulfurococcales archaeon]|nr:MFS transporter [Desulfurococcales archaeon]